jgi:monoamine oxidase
MFYDYIIIGGGIGGVYTAYQIHRRSPESRVLLLEKENYLGGRVETYRDEVMQVEAGAGRFSGKHRWFMKLLEDLKLKHKVSPITSEAVFIPLGGGIEGIQNSVLDAPSSGSRGYVSALVDPFFDRAVDASLGKNTLPNAGLLARVILASKIESKEKLQRLTFSQYAATVLNDTEVLYIQRTFGYYSELVIMNAYDAIRLMETLGTDPYFILKGGLSQVIDQMVKALGVRGHSVEILMRREVKRIVALFGEMGGSGFQVQVVGPGSSPTYYFGRKCICALPGCALEKLAMFRPLKPLLRNVVGGSLCRIYSRFDPDPATGKVWFDGIPKFTTDASLRMVLPMDTKKGILMTSYSDHRFAHFWNRLYEKKGVREVNRELRKQLQEVMGDTVKIPMPKHTQIFYWENGVGYWAVGADSAAVSAKMLRPFGEGVDIFVCGENFSESGQQWMEGALETSEKVLSLLDL